MILQWKTQQRQVRQVKQKLTVTKSLLPREITKTLVHYFNGETQYKLESLRDGSKENEGIFDLFEQ